MPSQKYNRGDLAAQWLNSNIFENKTFNSMSNGDLPYIIINASDINTGMTFSFIQQQFDFLCSDISDYPVANAVTASSAVPGVFGPITLNNFQGECTRKTELRHSWVKDSLEHDGICQRRFQVARAIERYYDPQNMPKIRLVDGGVTDNLGVRGSMMSPVAHYGNVKEMRGAFRDEAFINSVMNKSCFKSRDISRNIMPSSSGFNFMCFCRNKKIPDSRLKTR